LTATVTVPPASSMSSRSLSPRRSKAGGIAPDACTERGELLDSLGGIVPGMYTVGPPTRGTAWESMAVPEIRNQAAHLAEDLTQSIAVSRRAMPVTGQ
jgi:uncharacterized NAD(P)/FAD-binding protein YdhS